MSKHSHTYIPMNIKNMYIYIYLGDTRDAFFQGFFSEKFFKAILSLREAFPYMPFSVDGKK
jgi:hypothetical protein